MTKAIRIHRFGGPEVMQWETVEVPDPGPGEVRVRTRAAGLNYIDVYHRTGLYPLELPAILGAEGMGVITAVGTDVEDFKVGDRIAYCTAPRGAYAEERIVPARAAVPVPEGISDATAAASLLKGLTAWYLLRRTYPLQSGETILFHAAAGGVGSIAVQWAKHLGATVIGTVGSEEKEAKARGYGCDHVIRYDRETISEQVKAMTDGAGVSVVYDSVGQAVFMDSLECLRPLGMMVNYGNASGPVEPLKPLTLAQKGSLFLTRPVLFHYVSDPKDLRAAAATLFDLIKREVLTIEVNQQYSLADTAQAHRDLEARKTTGATVLLPPD